TLRIALALGRHRAVQREVDAVEAGTGPRSFDRGQEPSRDLLERTRFQNASRSNGLSAETADHLDPGLGLEHAQRPTDLTVGTAVHGQELLAFVEREVGAGARHRVE